MKKNYLFVVAFCVTLFLNAQTIFINEIHYDNAGADEGEGVEICGSAGTDLTGYKLSFYNGSNSGVYVTKTLTGIFPNQQDNRGVIWFPQLGIQNGSPDGIALVDDLGEVIQFLSYEGTITAVDGPAIGLTSEDIGVSEPGAIGESLQLIGTGNMYSDFSWIGPVSESPGSLNANQTLAVVKNQIKNFKMFPNPVTNGFLEIEASNFTAKKVAIYSMLGKLVYTKIIESNEILDLTNLTSNMYMIKVEEDGKLSTRKLIIK
ncbi:MAG: T9SS type A sorting domain-containing protein [Lutibacter sp.]|uniref:T9SS type A sorting domain-containing protein n=1 Tax=Lutibacter sp. TaxID=1925666 RepID=UPI001A0798AB|nr:T9SS type A sorting domain-containing protein [Lutibacter sp.]NOR27817.1 T9SS type A sorting domain-containing protein [Lutibacter sp.]